MNNPYNHESKSLGDKKEYILMTRSGYRHFFVLGKDLHDAEENFMRIDEIERSGFTLDDLPIRLENSPEIKNFSMEDFWIKNENTLIPIPDAALLC